MMPNHKGSKLVKESFSCKKVKKQNQGLLYLDRLVDQKIYIKHRVDHMCRPKQFSFEKVNMQLPHLI